MNEKCLSIVTLGTLILLLAALIPASSQQTYKYDQWLDINDDGIIDIRDLAIVAKAYGSMGTPINKTDLLLKINASTYSDLHRSGSLLQLPYFAKWHRGEDLEPYTILLSLDIDQSKPGDQQSVFVRENATITVTGTFQIYSPDQYPADIGQVFFIYSWTPSWPPPNGFYQPLYNGQPGVYPGKTLSFNFDVTIPIAPYGGVHYLYFCSTFQYSMESAVSLYTKPLWVPYAIILVGP